MSVHRLCTELLGSVLGHVWHLLCQGHQLCVLHLCLTQVSVMSLVCKCTWAVKKDGVLHLHYQLSDEYLALHMSLNMYLVECVNVSACVLQPLNQDMRMCLVPSMQAHRWV